MSQEMSIESPSNFQPDSSQPSNRDAFLDTQDNAESDFLSNTRDKHKNMDESVSESIKNKAEQISRLQNVAQDLQNDITEVESRKFALFKKMNDLTEHDKECVEKLEKWTDERDKLDDLISNIQIGYNKVEATVKSLNVLANRQALLLTRKYKHL